MNMGRKKKVDERTCGNCRFGPEGPSDDCEMCEDKDQWNPIEPTCDGIECKVSVNGSPAVPFPSKEATERVTEMVKNHLDIYGRVVRERTFGDGHVLTEYADDKVSLDGSAPVSKEAMKVIMEGVKELGTDTVKKVVGAVKQLDLEGKPLPEPDVEDDDETEVREFTIYRSNGLVFRMGSEGLEKALEFRKKESVSDSKDRIKLLVQNRSKVMSGMRPLDPNRWDAGTRAIYERIMSGHGRDF
jgi:hypothetical protein